jgi:hypothetical protein
LANQPGENFERPEGETFRAARFIFGGRRQHPKKRGEKCWKTALDRKKRFPYSPASRRGQLAAGHTSQAADGDLGDKRTT